MLSVLAFFVLFVGEHQYGGWRCLAPTKGVVDLERENVQGGALLTEGRMVSKVLGMRAPGELKQLAMKAKSGSSPSP